MYLISALEVCDALAEVGIDVICRQQIVDSSYKSLRTRAQKSSKLELLKQNVLQQCLVSPYF